MNGRHHLTVWMITAVLLAGTLAHGSQRPADFGKRWTRSNPFALMGLTIMAQTLIDKKPFDFEQYKRQNYSFLLAWRPREPLYRDASRTGFPWFLNMAEHRDPDNFRQRTTAIMAKFPGNVGLLINDEPTLHGKNNFERTGKAIDWARRQWPDKLVLSNIGGTGGSMDHYFGRIEDPTPQQREAFDKYSYDQYVRDFVRITRPDVLMFDSYIFNYGKGNESGVTDSWFYSLGVIRREALRANLPYWAWMQSWDRPSPTGYNLRLPSDSDYRMQVFCVLAYGFTGLADFLYCGAHDRDLLMPDGTPSPLFEPAAKVHAEVAHLGKTLRLTTSTHVAFLPGWHESRVPSFLDKWNPGDADDRRIRSVKILGGGRQGNGLIGHFKDDQNKTYFMLTNLYQHADKNADECALDVHITFDPSVKAILKLSRQTGQTERLAIDDPEKGLTLRLPGGTGDLFKYTDEPFPGTQN